MSRTRLRLLTWDDPRATGPLHAAVSAYREVEPTTVIDLRRRALSAFNDEPIEVAAERSDLLVYDHPMVPRAVATGALAPLGPASDHDPDDEFGTVGASGASYDLDGRRWGLAIDAACQVMVTRTDVLETLGRQPPTSLDDLLGFADDHAGRVLLPLYPSDAFCTLLSLSAVHARAAGEPVSWLHEEAVAFLSALVARTDPRGFDANPPAVLRAMRDDDRWALAPFVFGYANATRSDEPTPLRWHDLPALDGARASVLGGAGLGVSAHARDPEAARRFARWYASSAVQRSLVVDAGGQPALRTVWDDPVADRRTGGFFSGTRRTMDAAFQRPATPWWPAFHDEAGRRLVELLARGRPPSVLLRELRRIHDRHQDTTPRAAGPTPDDDTAPQEASR